MRSIHLWTLGGLTALMLTVTPLHAANVLILDDDYGTEVMDDLVAAGHSVTSVLYFDWDGTNPGLNGFDAVLLLKGKEYGQEIGSDEDSLAYGMLIDFIESGGIFAATEWLVYDMNIGRNLALESIVPFDYTSYDTYNYSGTYTLVEPDHPLAAGLPATWDAEGADGGVCVEVQSGARIVISRSMDLYDDPCMSAYALSYVLVGQGVSIHLNSDLGHDSLTDASEELLQVIRNTVELNILDLYPIFRDQFDAAEPAT